MCVMFVHSEGRAALTLPIRWRLVARDFVRPEGSDGRFTRNEPPQNHTNSWLWLALLHADQMIGSPVSIRLGPQFASYLDREADRALFLDRDGVLNADTGYLRHANDLSLFATTVAAIGVCNRAGVPVVVVSNQSGVARGLMSWPDLVALDDVIAERLAANDVAIDVTIYAGVGPGAKADILRFRKPETGMIEAAARLLRLQPSASAIVGDKPSDLEAARRAGLGFGALVGSAQDLSSGTNDAGWRSVACPRLADAVGAALRFLGLSFAPGFEV